MNEKMQIYDELCRVLGQYEESQATPTSMEETLYAMLVKIQVNWETVITAENA